MVFPVVIYECKSWTIKKAECRRVDAFELCPSKQKKEILHGSLEFSDPLKIT